MPRNGSGSYSLPAGNPVVTGTTISSTDFNNTMTDIGTALTSSIAKDGQTVPTANLPMGTYKITGLGAGTAATDAAQLAQVQSGVAALLGGVAGTNAITATGSPTLTAYASGQTFRFIPAATNTGATTINIDSLGAKNVYANGVACIGGEIVSGVPTQVMYDGTQFNIVGPFNGVLNKNVGIGVTPSAWNDGLAEASALQIGGLYSGAIYSDGTGNTWWLNNAYYNSGWKYKSSGQASYYEQNGNAHVWGVAPSGTAGNAITFTTAMTLDGSGNLGIGGTSGSRVYIQSANSAASPLLINNANGQFINTGAGNLTPASGENAANAILYVRMAGTTSRSINAAGTINASGADYAEYERNNGLVIAKGSIVGFKADGTLTLTFSEAVRFGVKSTNPSYVGGDTWGSEEQVGVCPEQPADDAEQSVKDQYEADLAAFEAALEAARVQVDRIAYSGKVPVNVTGATPGDYIIAVEAADGSITGQPVADPDLAQYRKAVGRVNRILEDGRAEIAVIVH